MALGHVWAGFVYGTNTGNIFLRLEGADNALKGTLHLNDRDLNAIVVYAVTGSFDGTRLTLAGMPQGENQEGIRVGALTAAAKLQPNGQLQGEWETNIGSAGTFVLFPHDNVQPSADIASPDQIHSTRWNFGPIEIDREQIIALGDNIQRNLPRGRLIVTFTIASEQSRYLDDFRRLNFTTERAQLVRLFVRQPDVSGIEKQITVEFGPNVNWATAQGADEAWVLGELEKLKREILKFQRNYASRVLGVTFNEFLIFFAVVLLPSLSSTMDRIILLGGALAIARTVDWLHRRYLPHAAIYPGARRQGWAVRNLPLAISWLTTIGGTVIGALLVAYLKGYLKLP